MTKQDSCKGILLLFKIFQMKQIIILSIKILLIIYPSILFSQVYYFNNRYQSVSNKWSAGKSIVELEDSYIIGGTTGHPSNEAWLQISLFKIDLEGNKLYENIIGDLIAERDLASSSLIVVENNGIYFSGNKRIHTSNWVHDQCMLIKINSSLETIWTKYYGEMVEPYDTSYLARHSTITANNGFAIVGNKMPYGLPSKIFFIKTNETGEKEWECNFGTGSYYYQGFSVIQTTDGGYAIGGYRFLIGQSETPDPIIYKTDSMGNYEWEKNLGGPLDDYHPMLTLGKDGNIVVGTSYCDSMITPSDPMRITNIVKLDNEGTILWDKKYGSSIHYNDLMNIRTTEDGNYIANGFLVSDFPHRSGWLLKLSQDGDSIWYRQYDNLLGADSRNYLYDVIPTSDNGFAACGYVIPYPPDPGSQDAWVLKVDSMGCDTPGCATGTQVFELPNVVGDEMKVWPNPVKEKFQVTGFRFQVDGQMVIKVYNSQGLKVEEVEVPDGKETITVNVQDWQKGMYFIRLLIDSEERGCEKIIVN